MTVLHYYVANQKHIFESDKEQLTVIEKLQAIQQSLCHEEKLRKRFRWLRKPRLVKGLYLWGSVGVGKTYLMNCFFHSIPTRKKTRMHFFTFMQFIHHQLSVYQGEKDPLAKIAKKLAKQTLVICLDEFFVKEIVDAMLIARLLKLLFKEGVCLVATSNVEPQHLYYRGLQREQFLPTIELLHQYTEIWCLSTQMDYRRKSTKNAPLLNHSGVNSKLETLFKKFAKDQPIKYSPIEVNERKIYPKQHTESLLWLDFSTICGVPRAPVDYLVIAKRYKIIFISNIPLIKPDEKNLIRLFISMIDIFYDEKVKLIYSCNCTLHQIYNEGDMLFEFKRTLSRLQEMQFDNGMNN